MKRCARLQRCRPRSGKTLVLFVITLPVLLGMSGLVIDSGLLMVTQRTVQNAADAGAMAAAVDLYRGASSSTAIATGTTFIQTYNGLSGSTATLNIPPQTGPYINNPNYCETIVSLPYTTSFIQVLGINSSQTISARAVAGYEPISPMGQGVIALRSDVQPGIQINGSTTRLIVNGGITDNSPGGGVDQYNNPVSSTLGGYGFQTQAATQSPAPVVAAAIQVAGGVDNIDNFRVYNSTIGAPNWYDSTNIDRPVLATGPQASDLLQTLATPTTSNGVVNTLVYPKYLGSGKWDTTSYSTPQNSTLGSGDTATFPSGIYGNITINSGASVTMVPAIYAAIGVAGGTVTLNSGIYVLNANGLAGTQTLSISGGTVTSASGGVMFYNTGSDYNPVSGAPDASDGNTLGTDSSATFGQVAISGGNVTLSSITSAASKFVGMLFYQRRWNSQPAQDPIFGGGSTVSLSGTLYDKWGNPTLSGQGQYNAQFVVGTLTVSGNGTVTINATSMNQNRLNLVFQVE